MAKLFADAQTLIEIPFDDDITVVVRKYADAGIQEDLDAEMTRVKLSKDVYADEDVDEEDEDARYAVIHVMNLKFIQKMLVRIESGGDATFRTAPIGMRTIRSLSREAFVKVLDTINEFNPPLDVIRQNLVDEAESEEQNSIRQMSLIPSEMDG